MLVGCKAGNACSRTYLVLSGLECDSAPIQATFARQCMHEPVASSDSRPPSRTPPPLTWSDPTPANIISAAKNNRQHLFNTAAIMQASNRLRTVFADGKQAMGMWQMIPGANVSRILASSGVDWIMVDCEHGNMDGKH
ncbi:Pyruvate/Phosphoenolpyruvate kinase [Cordyceps militaris CM01]|uniref:Pyruvate/Phosphoenolpyruvate kinase n=1 Tax=Cordyceps militaris (strain CM01) TaxID=983644 RepID=G3JLR6_CORMM|nr:Pyruvate/Phosphoenolpyruvate kinase [Cordyceps militaris CM01]EGX90640.1 Pyruvate/Phosphoenolpyruvate kinase [Cordyceps militaris CM01]